MKKIFNIVIYAICIFSTTNSHGFLSECPDFDTDGETILLPDENNCNNFFICSNGNKIEMNCPSTLHFNKELQVCDYPEKAGCKSTRQRDEYSICEKTSVIFHPHEYDCSKFIMCSNGEPFEFSCPPGLNFDPELTVCNWPDQVKCGLLSFADQYQSENVYQNVIVQDEMIFESSEDIIVPLEWLKNQYVSDSVKQNSSASFASVSNTETINNVILSTTQKNPTSSSSPETTSTSVTENFENIIELISNQITEFFGIEEDSEEDDNDDEELRKTLHVNSKKEKVKELLNTLVYDVVDKVKDLNFNAQEKINPNNFNCGQNIETETRDNSLNFVSPLEITTENTMRKMDDKDSFEEEIEISTKSSQDENKESTGDVDILIETSTSFTTEIGPQNKRNNRRENVEDSFGKENLFATTTEYNENELLTEETVNINEFKNVITTNNAVIINETKNGLNLDNKTEETDIFSLSLINEDGHKNEEFTTTVRLSEDNDLGNSITNTDGTTANITEEEIEDFLVKENLSSTSTVFNENELVTEITVKTKELKIRTNKNNEVIGNETKNVIGLDKKSEILDVDEEIDNVHTTSTIKQKEESIDFDDSIRTTSSSISEDRNQNKEFATTVQFSSEDNYLGNSIINTNGTTGNISEEEIEDLSVKEDLLSTTTVFNENEVGTEITLKINEFKNKTNKKDEDIENKPVIDLDNKTKIVDEDEEIGNFYTTSTIKQKEENTFTSLTSTSLITEDGNQNNEFTTTVQLNENTDLGNAITNTDVTTTNIRGEEIEDFSVKENLISTSTVFNENEETTEITVKSNEVKNEKTTNNFEIDTEANDVFNYEAKTADMVNNDHLGNLSTMSLSTLDETTDSSIKLSTT